MRSALAVSAEVYRRAATAIATVTEGFDAARWSQPSACDGWSALDVAGHVLCVVQWHHEWLDASLAGAVTPPWPAIELPARNAAALAALDIDDGHERVERFTTEAAGYAERIEPVWDQTYVYPGGTVTVGAHASLVVGEWNVHAWDIDRAHRPSDDDAELVRATWITLGRPIDDSGDAWPALLRATGRGTS